MLKLRYDIVLIDADETIFDFRKAEYTAFNKTLADFGFSCNDRQYMHYSKINASLWAELEKGTVTRETLKTRRFELWAEYMGITFDYPSFNKKYAENLSKCGFLIEGAYEFLKKLSELCSIYIITNGLTVSQSGRFEASDIKEFVKGIFISESIGFAKPDKKFFDYCIEHIGVSDRSRYIIMGDSLSSDMKGGRNAGIDTCRFNRDGEYSHSDLCDYEIVNYDSFFKVLESEK